MDTPDGRGTVVEVDLLRQRVKVKMEDHPETITAFSNTEIAVLRSGKAKKTDPPIPADLAPISGNRKKPTHVEAEEEKPLVLESIRLRYSEETIADEVAPEAPKQPEEPNRSSNRRRRNRKPKLAQPENAPKQPKPEKAPEQPKQQAADKEARPANRPHHRRHHRPRHTGNKKPQA